MKKIILLSALFLTTTLSAQVYQNSKFWSAALNVGGQALTLPALESNKFYQPSMVHVNAAYKFNHIYGVRPSATFHSFNVEDRPNTKYVNASLDFFVDFNQMGTYGFRENMWEWSVLGYLGFGYATMWNDRQNMMPMDDPFIEANDDMMSFTLGITPRMRIGRNLLFNVDLAYVAHHLQDQRFDFDVNNRRPRGFGGGILRFGFGITYEFIK